MIIAIDDAIRALPNLFGRCLFVLKERMSEIHTPKLNSTGPKKSGQGPFFIWHGMTLSAMVQLFAQHPNVHWSQWLKLAMMPGLGLFNSTMSIAEDLVFGSRIRKTEIEHPPLFILGFWRSGTTLLHNLMTRDPQFTYPTLYTCFFPNHFLLTEKAVTSLTGCFVPKSRPMDNLPASWHMPQEDELALCIQTLISGYLFLGMQQHPERCERFYDLVDVNAKERDLWERTMVKYLKRMTIRENKTVVLKSPSHTFRIPTLLKLFPNAKFLYIHRNPYETVRSAFHLRRTMLQDNGLGRPCYMEVEECILRLYENAFHRYEDNKHLIPEGNLHEVRYEDLESDPLGELEKTYSTLGYEGFDRLKLILEPELPALKRFQKNAFEDDPTQVRMIYDRLRYAFEKYDYPAPVGTAVGVA